MKISVNFNIKKKSVGFYVCILAVILALVCLICCCITGKDKGDITGGMIACLVLGLVFDIVALFVDFHSVPILLGAVLTGVGFIKLLNVRLNTIGLILNGVITETIPTNLIVGIVFGVLAMAACCVVAFMGVDKKQKATEATA
ncbi:MAG: hypothetical protein LUD50_03585 [Clostridia bacterium]|nr:hypothetical protein [Clostridia bacterium]